MQMMIAAVPGYKKGGNFHGKIARYLQASPGEVIHGRDALTPPLRIHLTEKGIRTILMMRDPRDQAISRMFHVRREQRHEWHARMQTMPDDEALLACIEGRDDEHLPGLRTMINITNSWLAPASGALVVRYEDVLGTPEPWVQRVFAHLHIPASPRFQQAIIQRHRFERLTVGPNLWQRARPRGEADSSSHFRKGITGDWKNHFSPRHIARFKEIAGDTLIAWGYEQNLDW